jgi:hypothetical protein
VAGNYQGEGAILSAPPVITPKKFYDAQNEATFREEVRRKLDGSYDRRSNLTVPFGKKLSFTSAQGQVISFGYNTDGQFTIQQGASTPFGLANISYVSSVQSGLSGSIATVSSTLTAAYQAADTTLQANITNEATARATADSAEATTRASADATLTSSISTVSASVTTETTARVNGDNALASQITTLTTNYQTADTTLQANITSEATARSSADSALATRASALEATVDTPTTGLLARVTTTESAIATNTSAISTVSSEVVAARSGEASLVARIGTVNTAAVNAAGAAATAQSEVTAARQGEASLTAKVTQLASATSTVDGKLSASYALTVDGGGRIASMKLLSNGSTSSVKFTADTFQVFNGSTDVAPFVVEGGVVKAKNLQAANLSAITASTGSLTVSGTLTLGTNGKLITSGTGYDGNGIFLGEDGSGVYKFSVGGSSGRMAFDGTNLTLPGGRLVGGSVLETAIASGAVTASKISVNNLSAVSAIIGTLRTATSGARVEIKDNIIEVYDATRLRVRLGIWT